MNVKARLWREKYVNATYLHAVSTGDVYVCFGINLYSIGASGVDKREHTSVFEEERFGVNVGCIADVICQDVR